MLKYNYFGSTALHYAAKSNSSEIITLLLRSGADINAQDDNGYTPIMYAIMYYSNEAVIILKEMGADLSIISRYDGNALSIALLSENYDVIDLLSQS